MIEQETNKILNELDKKYYYVHSVHPFKIYKRKIGQVRIGGSPLVKSVLRMEKRKNRTF
jgi:hypothetical protein